MVAQAISAYACYAIVLLFVAQTLASLFVLHHCCKYVFKPTTEIGTNVTKGSIRNADLIEVFNLFEIKEIPPEFGCTVEMLRSSTQPYGLTHNCVTA